MSSAAPSSTPSMDRSDVHRSSRSLEQIVGLFHDYCQAASACATIKKKLSRAMKEASQAKGTHPIAGAARSSNLFHSRQALIFGLSERVYGSIDNIRDIIRR